ncbi:MAG: murein biosynthesis integral membrane protein MurJ [Turneriella sp.]|nr:murein biosynthesis integral membrane protein MurJ [Turneriella sp.]
MTSREDKKEILQSSSVFSAFTALSRVLGLLRDMLKAYAFGTGPLSVAFDIAFRLNNMLRNLVAEGALSQAFVPLYNRYLKEGEASARQAAGAVITFTALVLGVATCLIIIALPWLLPLLLAEEHLEPGQLALTVRLSQLLFPYLVLMSVAALFMGIQYAHRIFWAASFGPALLNIVILVLFGSYALWVRMTGGNFGETAIYVFSLATLAAAVVQAIFQMVTVHRQKLGPHYRLNLRHPVLRALGSMMLPAVFAASLQELGQLVDVYLATALAREVPEAVSALTYSHRLIQLPIGIFGVAVATASLPQLARVHQSGDSARFSENFTHSLRLNFFFMLPAIAGLVVFARPIVELIFERGAFTARSSEVTALALACYAPGILAYSLQKLCTATFYARMDTRTPALLTALTLALNILFSLLLMRPLLHGGLAAGSALAAWCGIIFYFWVFIRRKILEKPTTILSELLPILFLNAIFVVALLLLRHWLLPQNAAFQLAIAIPAAVLFYFALAKILRIAEAEILLVLVKKVLRF